MCTENLGPGVKEIVEMLGDSQKTVKLKDLLPGDQLFVKVGVEARDLLDFVIIKPAKEKCDGVNDSARAFLPGWKWSSKCTEEKVEVLIGGSCTYNPGAPLGMTMLSIGALTVGRNLIIWFGDTDQATVFKTEIQAITLMKRGSLN